MPRQFSRRDPKSTGSRPTPVATAAMNMPIQPVTQNTITRMMPSASVEAWR